MSWDRLAGRPLVIAHRGACAEATENTMAAFALARDHGADGVELDARLCATGEVVVFHDNDLRRLAGQPMAVESSSWSTLRRMRLDGVHRIPLLDEVLEELAASELRVNIELKTSMWEHRQLARAVAALIQRHRGRWPAERLLVSSFDPAALAHMRSRATDIPLGLLFHGKLARPLRNAWAARVLRPMSVHPERHMVSQTTMARWRRAGYRVVSWTVDRPTDLARLNALGVDAVITNDPALALSAGFPRER